MTALPKFDSEEAADEHLVKAFSLMMTSKLAASRAKGRGGWYDPARCTIAHLEATFFDHLGKTNPGNYLDLANLAMMIALRQQMEGTPVTAEPEAGEGWWWWASSDGEMYRIGPCASRDQALHEAVADGVGEQEDGSFIIHLCEARQDPLRIGDWITHCDLIEAAEEAIYDSDRVSPEFDDVVFDVTGPQGDDLMERIKTACDNWQHAHGLKFSSSTFSEQRSIEEVVVPAPEATAEPPAQLLQ